MNQQQIKDKLIAQSPPCVQSLGGQLTEIDCELGTATMTFRIPLDYCHSGDIVQGGFVAAMLDATMYSAVVARYLGVQAMPTLELKVSYLMPSRAGEFSATASVIKAGKSTVFIEARLYNADGEMTATGSSTARVFAAASSG
jgi:uncharacterized protein (TIGR00369 family)